MTLIIFQYVIADSDEKDGKKNQYNEDRKREH